ncbi:MAG: PEP-utilizing enzyme [Lachnospiraceae bacterium]
MLGFVTRYGTINSHTAVIASTKGIPAVIGLGDALKKEYDGKTIIIDGFEGKVHRAGLYNDHPDEEETGH